MELIDYLSSHFLTTEQLLETAQVPEADFRHYQQRQLVPQASYTLNLNLSCESFFGTHGENHTTEYYAKGYVAWLATIQTLGSKSSVYSEFARRYTNTIETLRSQGHQSTNPKVNNELAAHIEEEWGHFLGGTYGLCTRSGLPEDIAAKELAIVQIKALVEKEALSTAEKFQLENAVNLLDQVSSPFAPHERSRSSRQRLVDEVRRKYLLNGAQGNA